jgi:FecR protein
MGSRSACIAFVQFLAVLSVAAAITAAAPAFARVGVTSETNGDPTGKPPTEAERILRVGIDIQANELITTKDNDRAHLVFLDGTSLTVAPNAKLKIDKFVYDPDGKVGDIALTATTGVFRIVGGKISKKREIVVNTPSAVIGLRGGIALFDVGTRQTTSQFLFGQSMVVTANGHSETAHRPGSQILTSFGGLPGSPTLIPQGGAAQIMVRLEGLRGGGGNYTADERARSSGFSDHNSGRGTGPLPGLGGPDLNRINNALANANNLQLPTAPTKTVVAAAPIVVPPTPTVVPPPPPPPVVVSLPPPPPPVYIPDCDDGRRFHHHHHSFHHFDRR